jgi:hypothetical protein
MVDKPEELKKHLGGALFSAKAFDLDAIKKEHDAVEKHAEQINSGASGALVRINAKNFRRILKERSLSENEFRILCAIYSGVGSQRMRRITKEELKQRALGYPSSKRDLQTEHWMTDHELRKARNALYKLKFFSMLTYAKRQTYYSNRLNEQQLHEQIVWSKTAALQAHTANNIANDKLTNAVKEAKQLIRSGAVVAKTRLRSFPPRTTSV